MLETIIITRVFNYNNGGTILPLVDPDPEMIPKDVRNFYSITFPELASAIVKGPDFVGEEAVYEFISVFGTKG